MLIASALWGVVRPDDRIPYYQFSPKTRLKGFEAPNAYWRPALAAALPDEEGELVVDMRSGAYAPAWKPKRATLLAVRAFTEEDGERKAVSHMAKAVRGDVARALLEAKKPPRDPEARRRDRRGSRLHRRALRRQPRRDRLRCRSARPAASGVGEVELGEGEDRDVAERGDRLAVGALDLGRLLRPGGEDDRGDLEARGAGGLERQQGVVDRPQAGAGDDDQRVAEVGGEVADQVGGGERDEEAADALADEHVGALGRGRARACRRRSGSISSPASAAARWGEAGGP